jgi:hypothetical protein
MKTSSTFNIISQLALAGALTAIVGCASSNYERGAATSASITDAANKIDAGKVKIDATLTSLNDLVNTSQGELAQIKNEDIKNRSAERKQTVQKEFTDIKKSYTEVQMAFEPFMSNLRDIQTALGNDLTMQGIASIKGAAEQADKHGAELNASVDKLAAEFRDLGVAMSTSAPTNAPPQ